MKIEKEVVVKAKVVRTPAKVKKTIEIVCDYCGEKLPNHGSYGWYPSCNLCGRDVCRNHQKIEDYSDGYPDWYCLMCHELYLPKLEELKNRQGEEQEALEAKYRKLSLAQPTPKKVK